MGMTAVNAAVDDLLAYLMTTSVSFLTLQTFNEAFTSQRTEADILTIVSKAEEFEQLKVRASGAVSLRTLSEVRVKQDMCAVCWQVRDEELEELDQLLCECCRLPVGGGVENSYGKINILLQTYISRGEVDSFSLISDLSYVAQVREEQDAPMWDHNMNQADV